jgi:hypothetical protein
MTTFAKCLLLGLTLLSACTDSSATIGRNGSDGAIADARSADARIADASVPDAPSGSFTCPLTPAMSCVAATDYCYIGELAFYRGDGGVTDGCNPVPAQCRTAASTCDCLLALYSPGFCTCSPDPSGGYQLRCSFV